MVEESQKITALILAGGRATRMGGADKGLVTLANQTMIEHVLNRVAPQVDTVLINANRNIDQYQALGHPVIRDTISDFQGPLAGMLAGLKTCNSAWLITAPCDSPLPPMDYVQRMVDQLNAEGAELAVATDGQRLQPVFCLLNQNLMPSLERFLLAGDRKIDLWFKQHRMTEVDFSDQPQAFVNINRQEELQTIEQLLL